MTQMLASCVGVRNMAIWLLWPEVMSNVHIFVPPFKGEQKFSKLFAILTRRNFGGKYLNHADCSRIAIKTHKHKARVEKQIQKCVVYGLTWEGFTDIILRVSVFRLLSGDQSLAFGTRFFNPVFTYFQHFLYHLWLGSIFLHWLVCCPCQHTTNTTSVEISHIRGEAHRWGSEGPAKKSKYGLVYLLNDKKQDW